MNKIEKLIQELCPEGIATVRLADQASYVRGLTYAKSDELDGGPIRVLRSNNIDFEGNILNFESVKTLGSAAKAKDEQLLRRNDILISAASGSRAHVGKVAYIHEDMDYYFGGFMAVLRTNRALDSRYLFHVLTSSRFRDYLDQAVDSTTINNLNAQIMGSFPLPLPPIQVQQEIVSILDKFTALEAELGAELEARGRQSEHLRSELVSAFSGSGVETVKFGEVASIVRGASPRPIQSHLTTEDNGVSWIKIGDVDPSEKYITKTAQMIKPDSVKLSRQVRPGDFVLSNSMSFGRPYISKINGCIHDGWLAISDFQERLDSDYLYHLLRSDFIQDELRKRASNGTVSNLNAEIVKALELPLPPLEKQTELAARLDSFEALIGSKSQGLPGEIQARRKQYEYYRNKLLTFKELDAA